MVKINDKNRQQIKTKLILGILAMSLGIPLYGCSYFQNKSVQEGGYKPSTPYIIISPEIAHRANLDRTLLGSPIIGIHLVDAWLSDSKIEAGDWMSKTDDSICLDYPKNKEWGQVSIRGEYGEDLSGYKTLSLEMKANSKIELLTLKMSDINQKEAEFSLDNISSTWKTYNIPLSDFLNVDLKKVSALLSFYFTGSKAKSLCIRQMKFIP